MIIYDIKPPKKIRAKQIHRPKISESGFVPVPKTNSFAFRRLFSSLLIFVLIFGNFLFEIKIAGAVGTTYYVDNCVVTGNDINNGTDPTTPWLTINKVNTSSFVAGDTISFRKGCTWREQLTVPSSGSALGGNITFGAYGATGANPILNGSAIKDLSGATLVVAGDVSIYSATAGSDADDGAERNLRSRIASAQISTSATSIKITAYAASGASDLVINGAAIGPYLGSGDAYDASALTRITWDGGSSATTIAHGSSKTSDAITYTLNNAVDQIVTMYMVNRHYKGTGGTNTLYTKTTTATDESQTANATGYGTATNNGFVRALYSVGATYSYTYEVAQVSDPGWVFENGTPMIKKTSIATVEGTAGSWWWDTSVNKLYTHASDGSNVASNSKTYEIYSLDNNIDTNGKNYITIDGIDCIRTAGSDSTLGGIKITGTNTTIKNLSSYNHRRHAVSFYTGSTSGGIMDNVTIYGSFTTTPLTVYDSANGTIIKNSNISNATYYGPTNAFGCVVVHGGADNTTIQNNAIHDCADGTNGGNGVYMYDTATAAVSITGNTFSGVMTSAVRANDLVDNVTISGNDISDTTAPAISSYTYAVDGWVISNNTIDSCGVATDTIYLPSATNATISGNTLTNSLDGDMIYIGGSGHLIHHNTITTTGAHGNGISIIASADIISVYNNNISGASYSGIQVSGSGVHIYNNYVHDNLHEGITTESAGVTGLQIYYNIITGHKGTTSRSGIFLNSGGNGTVIYNNTLYDNARGITSSGQTGIVFKNNIVSTNTVYGVRDATAWNYTFNNNDVYGNTTANYSGGTDPTGSNGNISANPLFTNSSGLFNLASDFTLQAGSPTINAGVDVSLTSDYAGTAVPQGGGYDMGAYEYTQSTDPTVSITAPSAGTVSGSTVTVSATASAVSPATISSVQFKLDNAVLQSAVTTPPYSIIWDTTSASNASHTLLAVATDNYGNIATSSPVTVTVDNVAPVRSAGLPSSSQSAGTTQTTLSLTTDENATCRYSTTAGTAYSSMTDFLTTGEISHSSTISGLSNGQSYNYYVRCSDGSNANSDDYTISFSVASPASSGGGGGCVGCWVPPTTPTGGFKITINQNASTASNRIVTLNFNARTDVKKMAISMTGDFADASQEDYVATKQWDLCSKFGGLIKNPTCSDGTYKVYSKFYTSYGVASPIASSSIVLKTDMVSNSNPDSIQPTTPAPQNYNSFQFTKNLQFGSNGNEVKELQNFLKQLGFFPQETVANGNFGPATKQAVMEYQKSVGLYPEGVVGSRTRKALNNQEFVTNKDYQFINDLKYGDTGEEVKQLQTRLRDRSFFPYWVSSTGWFGPVTQNSVKLFQKFYSLFQSGDVNEETRNKLNQ